MSYRVSIIITTRNRAELLRETLASFQRLRISQALPTELLIVDNGSTDHTAETIQATRLPQVTVRHLYEPKPGQAHARNRGLANIRGEVILFTDDDVRVPANWIEGMTDPIFSARTDAVAGGVKLAAHLERPWMTPLHRAWLASTERLRPEAPTHMVGANMAFFRAVLRQVPGFDPRLGPGALGYADETLFCAQLMAAGYRLQGALPVVVEHHVDPDRLKRDSWLVAAQKKGASVAYVDYHWHGKNCGWPARHQLEARARLWYYRQRNPQWRLAEGCDPGELGMVATVGYWQHFQRESGRPRHYPKPNLRPADEHL